MDINTFKQSCNVVNKLKQALENNNPKAFYTALQYEVLCKKVKLRKKEIENEYADKYMNAAGFYNEKFAVYTLTENGKKLFKPECYMPIKTITEMELPLEDRELTDECKELIKNNKDIPSMETYVNNKLQEEFKDITVEDVSAEELIGLGESSFDIITTKLADEYQKAAVGNIINKKQISLFLEQRYDIKTNLAKAYLKNKDPKIGNILNIGASKLGITIEDYAKMIVSKNDEWSKKTGTMAAMIDEYRVAVKALFLKSPKEAIEALLEANKVAKNPTPEKVNEVFNALVK